MEAALRPLANKFAPTETMRIAAALHAVGCAMRTAILRVD